MRGFNKHYKANSGWDNIPIDDALIFINGCQPQHIAYGEYRNIFLLSDVFYLLSNLHFYPIMKNKDRR